MAQYQDGMIANGPNGPIIYNSATGWQPLNQQSPRAITIGSPNRAKQERDAQIAANEAERIRLAREAAARAERADARAAEADARAREAAERNKYNPIPPVAANGLQENLAALRKINSAIAAINRRPQSIGIGTGMLGDAFTQLNDPEGTDTRAAVGEIGAQKIHDLSGAAVPASEAPRFKPFVPTVQDRPEVALQKLQRFRDNLKAQINEGLNYYGPANGYRPYDTPEAKAFLKGDAEPKATTERVPLIPGSDAAAPMGIAQGQAYSTPQDLALAAAVQKAYRSGGKLEDLFNAAKAQGYTPTLQDAQAWQAAIDSRNQGNPVGVLPRQSGRREGAMGVVGQVYGQAAANPYTSPLIAAGIGAGNAAAMGGLDELVGGIDHLTGGNYEASRDYANLGKQAISSANPGSYMLGSLAGTVAPALAGGAIASRIPSLAKWLTTLPGIMTTGGGYGAVNGALEDNQDRLGGALLGGTLGAGGGLVGSKVVAPLAERVMANPGAQALSEQVRAMINRARPNSVAPSAVVPRMTPGERKLPQVDQLNGVVDNLQDAARLNLPYALADAHPKLRNLMGSASRISPDVRAAAETTFDPRHLDQGERLMQGIDQHLAPTVDLAERLQYWKDTGKAQSGPLYEEAFAKNNPAWSPRVQQFLDDPLSRVGLAKGMEVQRLEALAAGKPFDPMKFSVTGFDEAGNPILSKTPNLRAVDAIRRGFGEILDDLPRDAFGNAIHTSRSRAIAQAKDALTGELDNISNLAGNTAYADARNTFGTYAKQGEALQSGYDAVPKGTYAEDIQRSLDNLTPPQLAEYQSGYATRMKRMVADTNDTADPYKLIYGGNQRRQKLQTVFPEGSANFDTLARLEGDMAKTRGEVLGGSPTAGRQQADASFMDDGMGQLAGDLAFSAATGTPTPGLLKKGFTWAADRKALGLTRKSAETKANSIAGLLMNTDPNATINYMRDLMKRQADQAARDAFFKKSYGLFGSTAVPVLLGPTGQ